jgi:quercetin dioxygenase-like cupin family protein
MDAGRRMARLALGATILVALPPVTTAAVTLAQGPVVVPVEREPRHRPVFENAVLAVLDVQLPPGYESLFHTHSNDNVSVRIETGLMRVDTLESRGAEQTALVGRVVFNPATPPYTHRVVNLGQTAIRILDIEILAKPPTPTTFAPDDMAGHEVIVDNPRVRISRIVLDPGEYLTDHTHPRGWLTAMVRGWPGPGQFSWQAAGSIARPIEAGPTGTERVEIEVK